MALMRAQDGDATALARFSRSLTELTTLFLLAYPALIVIFAAHACDQWIDCIAIVALVTLALFLLRSLLARPATSNRAYTVFHFYSVAIIFFSLFLALSTPGFAWDLLGGEWQVPSYAQQAIMAFHGELQYDAYRVPTTAALYLKLGLIWREALNYEPLARIVALVILWGACSTYVSALLPSDSSDVIFRPLNLFALLLVASPIFFNHVTLFGYLEVYLASALLMVMAYLRLYLEKRITPVKFCIKGSLAIAILCSIKSTGVVLAAAAVFSSFWVLIPRLEVRVLTACIAVILFSILFWVGFDVVLLGFNMSWDPQLKIATFSGREVSMGQSFLAIENWERVGLAVFDVFFNQLSFGALATIGLLSWALLMTHNCERNRYQVFLLWFLPILLGMHIAMFGSDYVARNSYPDGDTVMARTLIPFTVALMTTLIESVLLIKTSKQ